MGSLKLFQTTNNNNKIWFFFYYFIYFTLLYSNSTYYKRLVLTNIRALKTVLLVTIISIITKFYEWFSN